VVCYAPTGGGMTRVLTRLELPVMPASGHFILPVCRGTRCEWPASDVGLIGHQSREGT
jgi:hypothetical protein